MTGPATTDAATAGPATADGATATSFAMVTGDPSAMACEGDVCSVPGLGAGAGARDSA